MRRALKEAGVSWRLGHNLFQTAIVWLPTVNKQPVPGSPLIAETPPLTGMAESSDVSTTHPDPLPFRGEGRIKGKPVSRRSSRSPKLSPWKITVIRLGWPTSVELLCAGVGKDILAPGVLSGHDIRFWTTAWRWAGSLVARHQYLPGVEETGGTYRAVWQPLITGSDNHLAAHLAEAMPAVCRSLTSEAAVPPALPARAVLLEFLHQAVDHLVRLGPTAPGEPERRGRSPSLKKNFDSVHDQWLQALGAPTGVMVGDPGELAQLQVEVEKWRRPLAVTSTAPFRLCFRLEEPEPLAGESAGETWFVRYLLQAANDQSLLLPVPDAWEGKGQAGAWLHRGNGSAREYLLVSLAQSARICPAIEASLQSSLPSGHTLNTPGAQDFLNAEALLLEQAGFGVMLPSWWTGRGRVPLAVRAHVKAPKMQGGAGINLDQILSFDWQVALGEEVLSLDELRELANLKASLVKLRGQWVHVEAGEIAGALAFWQKKAAAGISARELLQMSLGGGPDSTGLAPAEVTAEGWLGDLLARLTGQASLEELPAPDNFQGSLRPYQAQRLFLAVFSTTVGSGGLSGRRYGAGKNHPGPGPNCPGVAGAPPGTSIIGLSHLRGGQLAERSGPVYPAAAGHGAPWGRAQPG